MPSFFTRPEIEWIERISADFVRWKTLIDDVPYFLDQAVAAWARRFTYRHPRLCEHTPHTHDEDKLVQYGGDYWKMPEVCLKLVMAATDNPVLQRMRHRLNWTKPKKSAGKRVCGDTGLRRLFDCGACSLRQ